MEVAWISIAILSAATLGLVNIFDSHLISKRMPSLRALMLPVGLITLVLGLIFLYLFPLPGGIGVLPLMVAVASGILRTASVVILLYTLKKEEVSRVVPVFSIYPVFVVIMAVPLLGETLNYLQGLAVAIVVVGAIMVSIKRSPGNPANWLGGTFFLLLGASLLMAMADIASKYALGYISFWNMYWLSILSMAIIFLIISLRRQVVTELANIKRPRPTLRLVVVNETLVVAGAVLMFWAMERGPVSLVSTIASTRPIFVVIYALVLSRFWPAFLVWQPGRVALMLKLVAISLIVGGIAIIYVA